MTRGPSIALLAILVGACAPVGIAEDWREAFIKVYNRTLTVVSFDGGWLRGLDGASRSPKPQPAASSSLHVRIGIRGS